MNIMEEQSNYQEYKKESKDFSSKKKPFWNLFLTGNILKEEFVVKQSKLIILIALLFVLFISNRYSCLKKLTEIDRLKTERNDIRAENLVISTELTMNSKQSQIEALVEAKKLGLTSAKSPAYKIKK